MTIEFPKFPAHTGADAQISVEHEGFTLVATIHNDDDREAPDERQDGFWPSLDPDSAGYIGDGKTADDLTRATDEATAIMDAWKADEFWYVGVAVTVLRNGVRLTDTYAHALWGIECNYPGSDNSYLSTVAGELADEALDEARVILASLCAAPLQQEKGDSALLAQLLQGSQDDCESLRAALRELRDYAGGNSSVPASGVLAIVNAALDEGE